MRTRGLIGVMINHVRAAVQIQHASFRHLRFQIVKSSRIHQPENLEQRLVGRSIPQLATKFKLIPLFGLNQGRGTERRPTIIPTTKRPCPAKLQRRISYHAKRIATEAAACTFERPRRCTSTRTRHLPKSCQSFGRASHFVRSEIANGLRTSK